MPRKRLRSSLPLGLFFALMLLFCAKLVSLQVVSGAFYAEAARQSRRTVETVAAARGELYDRNGTLLVGNTVTYALGLDPGAMENDPLSTLRPLVALCTREGLSWSDSLPLSWDSPHSFLDLGEAEQARFSEYLDRLGLTYDRSAQLLVDRLSHHYGLPEPLSVRERRALLGLLYACDLRSLGLTYEPYVLLEADTAFLAKLTELGLHGVTATPRPARAYHTGAAAHVLGRVGLMSPEEWEHYQTLGYAMDETVGKDGAERAFEAYLRPETGEYETFWDVRGNVLEADYRTPPKPGSAVFLTLDLKLQEFTESLLAETVQSIPGAGGAAAAILSVSDGAILTLASYPSFSLQSFSNDYESLLQDPLRPLFHRAVQGTYAPGSTFKLITALAALSEGIITPESQILDTGIYTYFDSPRPRCWLFRETGETHGLETVSEAIADSCNLFFYDVGRRLGIELLCRYAAAFGLGERSGIELFGEAAGALASPAYSESIGQPWYEGNVLSAAIGQENNRFTPLQLASMVATLCTGGERLRPHLLQEIRSFDLSETLQVTAPETLSHLDLAPAHLAAVKEGMRAVTEQGIAARYFADLPVTAGAKTGSAQVEGSEASNAVFVCFAPYENPEIALALVVEQGGAGAELAATAAAILDFYFRKETEMVTDVAQELQNGENSGE